MNASPNRSVTVVAVTSRKVEEHFAAITKTLACLPFKAHSLLITRPPWTIHDFNRFLMRELSDYIHTDFALTVHWDGYAINPRFWDNAFLDYDYIGAPWPKTALKEFRADPKVPLNWVGNGGFSLRSKKWMEATRGLLPKFHDEAEDVFCCRINTSHFLDQGCKIAPFELAQKFSYELPTEGYSTPWRSFGFHGMGAMEMIKPWHHHRLLKT